LRSARTPQVDLPEPAWTATDQRRPRRVGRADQQRVRARDL